MRILKNVLVSVIILMVLMGLVFPYIAQWTGNFSDSVVEGYITRSGYVAYGATGLTAGRVPYAASSTTLTDDADMTWNAGTATLSVYNIDAPTGRGATYVVAASDAPAHVKAQADYVCTKVGAFDDFDTIAQTAIDAAASVNGTVAFTAGDFYPEHHVHVKSNVKLELGTATFYWDVADGAVEGLFFAEGSVTATYSILASNCAKGANSVTVAGGEGALFAVGDYVWLGSTNVAVTSADGAFADGEFHKISSISTDTIYFDNTPTYRAYATADAATLTKLAMITNFEITGGNFIGSNDETVTPTVASAMIRLYICSEFKVHNTRIIGLNNYGIYVCDCMRGEVHGNYLEVRSKTGLDCYPIAVTGSCNNLDIHNNNISGGSHCFAANANTHGAPVMINVHHNNFTSSILATKPAVDVHESDSFLWNFDYNTIQSYSEGLSPGCIQFSATGNKIYSYSACILPRNATGGWHNVLLKDNYCYSATSYLVASTNTAMQYLLIDGLYQMGQGIQPLIWIEPATQVHARVDINNVRSTYGVITNTKPIINILKIDEVNISNCHITLAMASGLDLRNIARGRLSNNTISNSGLSGSTSAAVYLNATSNITIHGNTLCDNQAVPTQDYGIYATSSTGTTVYDNTFYGNTASPILAGGISSSDRIYNNNGYIGRGEIRTYSGTIATLTQNAYNSLDNPFGQSVRVINFQIYVSTKATATSPNIDCGIGSSATTDYTTLFDNVSGNTTGFYDSQWTTTIGKQDIPQLWASGSGNRYLNMSIKDAAATGMVATYVITVMGN